MRSQSLNMTEGRAFGLLFRFATPLLFGNLLQQAYNIVDSLVVGNILGQDALAAVGTSYPIIFLFSSLFMGLGLGATVIVAQYYGADDREKLQTTVDTIYKSFIVASIFLTVAGVLLATPLLRLMSVPEDVLPASAAYLRVIFLGSLATFGYNINAGLLQGIGDTISSLKYLAVATVVNIVLDIVFVGPCGMGVEGAAWATIIAQLVSFLFGVWHINRGHSVLKIRWRGSQFDRGILRDAIRLGFPAGLQNMFFSAGMMAMQNLINSYGAAFMAGYNAANKIDSLAFLPMISYSSAITTYSGQNVGAKRYDRLDEGLKAGIKLTVLTSAILVPIVVIFGPQLISLFLKEYDPNVVQAGMAYLWRVEPPLALLGILFIYNGCLRGLGQSMIPMLASLFSLWIGRIPVAYFLAAHYGRDNLFFSFTIGWLIGIALSGSFYHFGTWRKKLKSVVD